MYMNSKLNLHNVNKESNQNFEFDHVSTTAAGVPIFEIIRKLEEDQIIKKEDKLTINNALNNSMRRDKLLKVLCDVELGVNTMFGIK